MMIIQFINNNSQEKLKNHKLLFLINIYNKNNTHKKITCEQKPQPKTSKTIAYEKIYILSLIGNMIR